MQELTDDGSIKQVVDYFISGTGSLPEFQQNVAADAEEFVVATNATFPPYIYVDGDDFAGIDYVIVGLIADKLGMKLTVNDMEFDAIIPAVQSPRTPTLPVLTTSLQRSKTARTSRSALRAQPPATSTHPIPLKKAASARITFRHSPRVLTLSRL